MTAIDDAWNALREERRAEHGWHARRIHAEAPCEIFAGIRQPAGTPGLLLELSTEDVPSGLNLPQSKGFLVEPLLLGGVSGRTRFALVLADRAYETVFSVLCDDTARAASCVERPRAAIRAWVNRLHVWQEFMARHGVQGLTEAAALGLLGELLVMRNIVIPAAGAAAAIQAWSGPLGEPNDFAFTGGFLEVKATIRQAPERIEISDLEQLNDTRGLILLAHLRLRPSAAGESLPQVISTLRTGLARDSAMDLRSFDQLLMAAGYIDVQATLYDRAYELHSAEFFNITGTFPRIRPSDVCAGVRDVRYAVELSACAEFKVDQHELADLMGCGNG